MEVNPLPLVTNIFLPITCTLVGYQPTGINPRLLLCPGWDTSNTDKQLLSALAMYSVFSSALKPNPLVVDPLGASGYKAAFSVSITFRSFTCMMETELSFELATNKYFPFSERRISFGLSPTGISATIFFFSVSNT